MLTRADVVRMFSSQADAARALGVTRQAMQLWVESDSQVPPDRVLSIAGALGWSVTPHDLRPDIYPFPTDGLPPEVRERAA
jgi:DNA-binding transcriptional regulator YdaS (Cro superfamily)